MNFRGTNKNVTISTECIFITCPLFAQKAIKQEGQQYWFAYYEFATPEKLYRLSHIAKKDHEISKNP